MAVVSTIKLSGLENSRDMSPEFYKPEFLELSAKIRRGVFRRLGRIAFVTDGEHGSPEWDVNSSIKYITAEFIKEGFIEEGITKTISAGQDLRNARARVKQSDVLIYSVGAYAGMAAKAEPHLLPANIPRSVAIVRLFNQIEFLPEYLALFLNSRFGKFQSTRFRAGNSQPVLALEKIKQFEIPVLKFDVQRKLREVYELAYQKRRSAAMLYNRAEQMFEKQVGLLNWRTNRRKAYNCKVSQCVQAGRIDPQHFGPEHFEALTTLREVGAIGVVPLGTLLADLTNGHTPLRHNLFIGAVPFLCAEHVDDFRINCESDKRILSEHHFGELSRTRLRKGDVLMTIKGRIGNTAVVEDLPGPTNINQDVALFRMNDRLPTWFVVGFLNSRIGKLFIEQYSTGQINPFLALANLRRIPIPLFESHIMAQISKDIENCVQEASASGREAKSLLTAARVDLEQAIEQVVQ